MHQIAKQTINKQHVILAQNQDGFLIDWQMPNYKTKYLQGLELLTGSPLSDRNIFNDRAEIFHSNFGGIDGIRFYEDAKIIFNHVINILKHG